MRDYSYKDAFKALDLLEAEDFNLADNNAIAELDNYLKQEDEKENIEMIVDINADSIEDLKDSYVGNAILKCVICGTMRYCNKEDVLQDVEDDTLVNVGEECPHCGSKDGFNVIGEVAPFEQEEDDSNVVPDTDIEEEPSLGDIDDEFDIPSIGEDEFETEEDDAKEDKEDSVEDKEEKKDDEEVSKDEEEAEKELDAQIEKDLEKEDKEEEKEEKKSKKKKKESVSKRIRQRIFEASLLKLNDNLLSTNRVRTLKESEGFTKYDDTALMNAYNNGDVYVQFTQDSDGNPFLIVEGWDDVAEVQKLLDPSFEPKDEYDTSIIDNYMDWGFADEYTTCGNCGNLIRTAPDSYSFVPDFFVSDYDIICGDCVREEPLEYIKSLVNDPKKANTILSDSDLEDFGFVKIGEDYEAGWYDKYDDPKTLLNNALDENPYGEFIFSITSQGQWATNFTMWGLEETLGTDVDESCKKECLSKKIQERKDKRMKQDKVDEITNECDNSVKTFEELDEKLFDNLVNQYVNSIYENVDEYTTTSFYDENKGIAIEGVIKFKSGKEKNTKFVFEDYVVTKRNKVLFTGLNETFSNSKKAFSLKSNLVDGKLISESLTYNYGTKVKDESKRVYGRVINITK